MQVTLAVLATDINIARQISARLSDLTNYLATQNFPNVTVTSQPDIYDSDNARVSPSAGSLSRPALLLTAMLATAVVTRLTASLG